MTKSNFDPTIYHFVEISNHEIDDTIIWETQATPDGVIGCYTIIYNSNDDWFYLREIVSHNHNPRDITLYSGKIPDDDFAFQLFKNMELDLPIIQREIKIDSLF
jgi:hypothetical protein